MDKVVKATCEMLEQALHENSVATVAHSKRYRDLLRKKLDVAKKVCEVASEMYEDTNQLKELIMEAVTET